MSQAASWGVSESGPQTPGAHAVENNDSLDAVLSQHSGATRPSYAVAQTVWVDVVSATEENAYFFDGTNDILIYTINPTANTIVFNGLGSTDSVAFKTIDATVANTENDIAGVFTQNDTTNNPICASFINTGTGNTVDINHDGATGVALNIDAENTTVNAADIVCGALTSGSALRLITANAGFTSTSGLLRVHVDAAASGYAMAIQQEGSGRGINYLGLGTGNAINIDQDGNGLSIKVDSESTTDMCQFDGATGDCHIKTDGDLENTNNAYGAISDRKRKQDERPANSQWDDVKLLAQAAKKYRLKDAVGRDENAPEHLGFVAQDIEAISPGLVHESDDYEEVEVPVFDEDENQLYEQIPVLDGGGNPTFSQGRLLGYEKIETWDENDDLVITKGDPVYEQIPIIEDGNPILVIQRNDLGTKTKSVVYSIAYMKAFKALGEALERIETLEARFDAAAL